MGLALILLNTPAGDRWWSAYGDAAKLLIFALLAVTLWVRRDWLRDSAPEFAAYGRGFARVSCGKMFLLGIALIVASLVWLISALLLNAGVSLITIPFLIMFSVGLMVVFLSAIVKMIKMLSE
jgi:hypothetical protein